MFESQHIQDGEGNDLPALHLPEREFPILKLFPSGAKDTPVSLAMLGTDGKKGDFAPKVFSVPSCHAVSPPGLPTVLEIIEFVARNGKTKFSITDAMANAAVHAEVCWVASFCSGAPLVTNCAVPDRQKLWYCKT